MKSTNKLYNISSRAHIKQWIIQWQVKKKVFQNEKKTTSFSYVMGLTKYFVATTVCVYTVHLLEILYSSKANLIETRTQHHKHVQQLTRHFSNIFHIVHITFSQSIKHANRSTCACMHPPAHTYKKQIILLEIVHVYVYA